MTAKSTITNGQSGLSVRTALNSMFGDLYGGAAARHVVGNWYLPVEGITQNGGAPTANTIRLVPFVVGETVTISDLAAVITTLAAAGNAQLAIYNSRSLTDFRPGTLLGATGSLSTGSTGLISAAISDGNVIMTPGLYWMASNQDNATVAYTQITNTSTPLTRLVGDSTATNIIQATGGLRQCMSFTQTFGTWPDLTAQTLSLQNNNCAVAYKVAAVA